MLRTVLLGMAVCIIAAGANAAPILSVVGDRDALGTGIPAGELPAGPFDNRSATEAAATDGSQNTDRATGESGLTLDNTFMHVWAVPTGMGLAGAVLELGIGGMESNDTDPLTSLLGEDALFVNGALVTEAFAGVNQGPREDGILSISLPASVLGSFADRERHTADRPEQQRGPGPSVKSGAGVLRLQPTDAGIYACCA